MSFLTKGIYLFLANIMDGALSSCMEGIVALFQFLLKALITNGLVVSAQRIIVGISMSLTVMFCIKQYFDIYVLETSGDPEADPLDIIIRGSEATAFASCSSWIFLSFMNYCSTLGDAVLGSGDDIEFVNRYRDALTALCTFQSNSGFIFTIFMFCMLFGILAFLVIATIRAAELSAMYIIFPLFCSELSYANHERFNGLLTNIVVTGLYFILQLLFYKMFMENLLLSLLGVTATGEGAEYVMGMNCFKTIGLFIVMLRSPKWLDKFVYSTGLGDVMKRGGSTVVGSATRAVFMKKFGVMI